MISTIKKNFAYNAIYQVLIIILPIVTAPYVSRVLGPSRMGQYSYTYSIATYFLLLAKLGFDNYGNRSIARKRSRQEELNRTFTGIYILQLIIAMLSLILYLMFVFFISNYPLLSLIQGLWVVGALFDINWFFYGLEQFSIIVLRNTVVKIISVILIFVLVKQSNDLWKYTLILSSSSVAGFLLTWPFVFTKVSLMTVSIREILVHFRQTIVLFVPVIAISVFTVLDKIMLGSMASFIQVGYFEAAEKVMMAPKGIIGALGTVMLPRMANVYSVGDTKNKQIFINASLGCALVFSIGCMFGILGVTKTFVPVFFGERYIPAEDILRLMAFVLPFYAVGNVVRTQMLIPNMRDRPYVVSVVFGALVNVSLNFILIPVFGAKGAVIATLAAEIVIAISQLLAVLKEIELVKFMPTICCSICSSLCMVLIIMVIRLTITTPLWSLMVQVSLGGLTFLGVFVWLSFHSSDDILKGLGISIRNIFKG